MARFIKDRNFYRNTKYNLYKENKELGVEVYLSADKMVVQCFGGRRSKPDFHYRMRSAEASVAFADKYVADAEAKAANKPSRKSDARELVVGDILRNSWGYEQTNVDYFEVVELVGKVSVKIRPIMEEREYNQAMAGYCKPVPGAYIGEKVLTKRVIKGNAVKIHDWGSYAYKCDPSEGSYFSEYA